MIGFIVSGNPYQEILVGNAVTLDDAKGIAFQDSQARGWLGLIFVEGVNAASYGYPMIEQNGKAVQAKGDFCPYVIHRVFDIQDVPGTYPINQELLAGRYIER